MPNRASQPSSPGLPVVEETPPALDRLVTAAIAIADQEGLDAVSIRRIARELGTRPMSLYTYIASKDELLEQMGERIVEEILIREPLPADWRAAIELIASRSHEVFISHPWVLLISQRRRHLGRSGLRHAEQQLAAISPLGLSAADSWQVLFLINDYTLGHALRVAHAPAAPPNSYPAFDPTDFPLISKALEVPGPARGSHTFQAGLRILLDAVEQRYR